MLLADIKQFAEAEGRQLQSVLDEAMRDFVEKKKLRMYFEDQWLSSESTT
ncbi:MAG: hypothetical protein DHS20C09_13500 [marine bacterium B5-7]|nr:MAG: hypothetical protein DHS20C09_13500 [marine bacterium B5-7]